LKTSGDRVTYYNLFSARKKKTNQFVKTNARNARIADVSNDTSSKMDGAGRAKKTFLLEISATLPVQTFATALHETFRNAGHNISACTARGHGSFMLQT
jgi:hypothetical protein